MANFIGAPTRLPFMNVCLVRFEHMYHHLAKFDRDLTDAISDFRGDPCDASSCLREQFTLHGIIITSPLGSKGGDGQMLSDGVAGGLGSCFPRIYILRR